MDVLAEYRRRAAECERLAAEALTEDHRRTILEIATTWRALAEQRERLALPTERPPSRSMEQCYSAESSHRAQSGDMDDPAG